jgi:hypothetical protein
MQDSIVNFLHCPSEETSWDHTEWSSQSAFAVGCGRNSANRTHSIYAIDLNKKCYQQIVAGEELRYPYLWTGGVIAPSNFSLDSIGHYNDPSTSSHQDWFASKLLLFWKYFNSLEVIALGSSTTLNGFDPAEIIGLKSINLGYPGGDLAGEKELILHYIIPHCPKIKVICSGLDPGWLRNINGDFSWIQHGVGQSKGYSYDSAYLFWPNGVNNEFKNIMATIPLSHPECDANRGIVSEETGWGWGPNPPQLPTDYSLTWSFYDNNCQNNFTTIRMLADTLKKTDIHWIIINYPVAPYYVNTDAYSYWGPSRETAYDIISQLKRIEDSNPYFHLYDANNNGNHDYGESEAADKNHLNLFGAEKLTGRVDTLIDSILKKQ